MSELTGSKAATAYLCRIMTCDDVLSLKHLVKHLQDASTNARIYLQRHCQDVPKLESFLNDHLYLFFVENKKVALQDDNLEIGRDDAVKYFSEILLKDPQVPVDYMQLKLEHIDRISDKAAEFLTRFYPGHEFKKFFILRPNIFFILEQKVFLTEVVSVAYFKKRLAIFGKSGALSISQLRGHVGQATSHVKIFMNNHYLGEDFPDFFLKHNDVFKLDEDGNVSLVTSDSSPVD